MGELNPASNEALRVSPLQMALAAASLSNHGEMPAPRLVTGYETPDSGWIVAPETGQSHQVFQPLSADDTANALAAADQPIWEVVTSANAGSGLPGEGRSDYSWYLGGTLPGWQGAPLAIAVILEENDPGRVQEIGRTLLQSVIHP
jgi:membrane peptidoglycan carboxypeptidase